MKRLFDVRYERGLSYAEGVRLQEEAVRRLRAGPDGNGLLLCVEHAAVITFGRSARREHLLAHADELQRRGISLEDSSRGGDVTVHGPGQVTLYPVFPLDWFGRDLHRHMRRLEEVGAAYLAGHGLCAGREVSDAPRTGVWVGDRKIAAIGIAVRGWVVFHGLGMNVQTDLSLFDLIVPCGIADRGVTTLARETGKAYDMDCEMRRLTAAFFRVFDGAEPASGN